MFIEKRHSTSSLVPTNAIRAFGVDLVGTICVHYKPNICKNFKNNGLTGTSRNINNISVY